MNLNSKKYKDGDITNNINVIGKILVMINKYGIKNVISALIIFMIFISTIIIFVNQGTIINKIVNQQIAVSQENKVQKMEFRIRVVNPRVDAILYELIAKSKCDRAFVFEMHNGTDNPSGLPFVYGDMTYEKILSDTVQSVISQYERINLSSSPMASYICKNKYFLGDINEVENIDVNLAKKLKFNNVSYLYLYAVRGSSLGLGAVGITYINRYPKNISANRSFILDASQRLSILLDITNNLKEE